MKLNKASEIKLYPNEKQTKQFAEHCGSVRFIYNWGLNKWKELYENGGFVGPYGIMKYLPELKTEYVWLRDINAQSLQQSILNLGEAFHRFFKTKNGYPKFKKKGIRDSFRVPQSFSIDTENHTLKLPKIGLIKYRGDTRFDSIGTAKSVTVKRKADGWYASVLYEINHEIPIRTDSTAIGLDVGITKTLTTFDGNGTTHYQLPEILKDLYESISLFQKRSKHTQKGSRRYKQYRNRIARLFLRITNIRNEFWNQIVHYLTKTYAFIAVEDLDILNMSKSASGTLENPGKKVAQKRGLNRSITRQSWGVFFTKLQQKCVETGSIVSIQDAKYTSQTCPQCQCVEKANRPTQNKFQCIECDYQNNADAVAAMNVRFRLVGSYA